MDVPGDIQDGEYTGVLGTQAHERDVGPAGWWLQEKNGQRPMYG